MDTSPTGSCMSHCPEAKSMARGWWIEGWLGLKMKVGCGLEGVRSSLLARDSPKVSSQLR